MANKIRDYTKLAADICAAVGKDNILSATHCATRLRLVLRETPSDEVTKQISEMPAVIKVMESGGQYQVVIGTHAKDVYEALAQLLDLDNSTAAAPEVKQGLGSRIIATMSAVFAPFVYILAAAGLVQGALIIITHFFPAFAATGTYSVLSFISWTPFTFLPVMIAVTASKHFKCNTFIAMWCCMALVNPDWASIAARIADGEVIKFLAFPMSQTTYTSTVLPPLFLVLVLSWLEHWLDEHLPDIIKALAVPFICTIVMVPLTIWSSARCPMCWQTPLLLPTTSLPTTFPHWPPFWWAASGRCSSSSACTGASLPCALPTLPTTAAIPFRHSRPAPSSHRLLPASACSSRPKRPTSRTFPCPLA